MARLDRDELMVELYGEACTFTRAARMLQSSPYMIKRMIEDGRLKSACRGSRVDVRSIAHYIEAPEAYDEEARRQRVMLRNGSGFAV